MYWVWGHIQRRKFFSKNVGKKSSEKKPETDLSIIILATHFTCTEFTASYCNPGRQAQALALYRGGPCSSEVSITRPRSHNQQPGFEPRSAKSSSFYAVLITVIDSEIITYKLLNDISEGKKNADLKKGPYSLRERKKTSKGVRSGWREEESQDKAGLQNQQRLTFEHLLCTCC